jgi:hypothetical protein
MSSEFQNFLHPQSSVSNSAPTSININSSNHYSNPTLSTSQSPQPSIQHSHVLAIPTLKSKVVKKK